MKDRKTLSLSMPKRTKKKKIKNQEREMITKSNLPISVPLSRFNWLRFEEERDPWVLSSFKEKPDGGIVEKEGVVTFGSLERGGNVTRN